MFINLYLIFLNFIQIEWSKANDKSIQLNKLYLIQRIGGIYEKNIIKYFGKFRYMLCITIQ